MPTSQSTCWTVIRAAAAGSADDREELARRYLGVVRTYLAARWRGSALRPDLDDAVQEVFVACFKEGGAAGGGQPAACPFLIFPEFLVELSRENGSWPDPGSRAPETWRPRP
jgi:hypothetical protein